MLQAIRESLTDVIFNVLETMFFAVPEKLGEIGSDEAWEVEAVISLDGVRKTDIRLLTTKDLALSLAANFLGKEMEEVSDTELLDLAKEIANMIGGNLVTKLGDEEISLGLPDSRYIQGVGAIDADSGQIISFHIEDEPVMVTWTQAG